jgi:hypothetical protein
MAANPSREEFDAWLDHPVTRFVLGALERQAQAQEAEWRHWSWEVGTADQRQLDELRTRADAYRSMAETSYEGFCEAMDDDHRD